MKKILTLIMLISLPLMAQDITNKLGASGNYDITDSSDNVLLRVEENGEVGIGTDAPDATLDVHGTVKAFGAWAIDAYYVDVAYQASTDGFILARIYNIIGNPIVRIIGYTDSNNPPTTEVIRQTLDVGISSSNAAAIMMPVKKGNYFEVTDGWDGANTLDFRINWIPLGQ